MDKVKCADCGMLAVRHTQTRQLLDAEDTFRTLGNIPQIQLDHRGGCWAYDDYPVCFANQIRFRDESEMGRVSDSETRLKAIHKERECERFTPWIQGLTPKEHIELRMEEDRQLWQEQRDLDDRIWREKQAAQAREWRKEDEAQERKDRKAERTWKLIELAVMGGIVTVVSAIVQIIAAYISRGR